METVPMKIIARIHSDFPSKFGIPRQSGLVEALKARVVFEPDFRSPEAVRGLEGFSHIWLIWQFSQAVREDWSPTVRPPRLGGNARMGVFAGNFDGQPGRGSDRLDDADRRSAAFERRSLFDVQLGKTEGLPQAAAARLDVIGVEALRAQRVVKRNTAGVDAFPEFIRPDPAGQQLAADGGMVEAG